MSAPRPVGQPTRGTTGHNRLRRADRWLLASDRVRAALTAAADPLVVDLGYGALPVTTLELAHRLRSVREDIAVLGLEIDPERVAAAIASTAQPREAGRRHDTTGQAAATAGVQFELGGFELAGRQPVLVRAFNVLRQYPVGEVAAAWATMQGALAPGGLIVDGTCDELGRRCCWVLLDDTGPLSLTLACDPTHIERPSDLAERLPKVLIHQNVSGQPIHSLLTAADRAWASAAGHGVFGQRARWQAMLTALRDDGVPIEPTRRRSRDAVLTVPWVQVAPEPR